MSREEILREIDEAMAELRDVKAKANEALSHARNIVARNGDDEAGYNKGLEDAWKLAQKLTRYENEGGMSYDEIKEVFGNTNFGAIMRLSYQEALAKLEAYEKEQEEIKVGDVVRIQDTNFEYLVTHIEVTNIGKKYYYGISKGGKCLVQGNVEKTGKHIDISSILEQIGGGE